jgi:hypothetical protein
VELDCKPMNKELVGPYSYIFVTCGLHLRCSSILDLNVVDMNLALNEMISIIDVRPCTDYILLQFISYWAFLFVIGLLVFGWYEKNLPMKKITWVGS